MEGEAAVLSFVFIVVLLLSLLVIVVMALVSLVSFSCILLTFVSFHLFFGWALIIVVAVICVLMF